MIRYWVPSFAKSVPLESPWGEPGLWKLRASTKAIFVKLCEVPWPLWKMDGFFRRRRRNYLGVRGRAVGSRLWCCDKSSLASKVLSWISAIFGLMLWLSDDPLYVVILLPKSYRATPCIVRKQDRMGVFTARPATAGQSGYPRRAWVVLENEQKHGKIFSTVAQVVILQNKIQVWHIANIEYLFGSFDYASFQKFQPSICFYFPFPACRKMPQHSGGRHDPSEHGRCPYEFSGWH